ncbi:unknown protein [Cronobacter turicensis z3032]|uniref:Uncharacterized protein n=1 Tax=Cronobacter turicensis (strain DSM 18703 / CCUG 55852 / LMG 23827 / z3032) TaxID=693216 RepID=C9Y2W2_CROTZ|nr:unknown protein [Cronobacter turicensis z3032]
MIGLLVFYVAVHRSVKKLSAKTNQKHAFILKDKPKSSGLRRPPFV